VTWELRVLYHVEGLADEPGEDEMVVLCVLFGAWLALRGVGALGVEALASWHASAGFALAVMFVFTGIAHFTKTKHDMARMIPKVFARPMLMVYATGVCELLGAAGLIEPRTRALASASLILLMVAMFPANIKAAREGLTISGSLATPLWLRTPMQALFIGLLWWAGLN
jgi:uncharacterized membrane protein